MAPKQDPAPEPRNPPTAAGSRAESVQALIQKAYLDHLQALQNLSWNLQKRQGEALARYNEQLRTDLQGVNLADVYQTHLKSLQEAASQNDQTRATAAGSELIGAVQEAQATVQRSQENAARQYMETAKQALDDAQGELRDQHLAYSRVLSDAWARTNQGDPDPRTLVLLSQSLLAAALTAPLPAR